MFAPLTGAENGSPLINSFRSNLKLLSNLSFVGELGLAKLNENPVQFQSPTP